MGESGGPGPVAAQYARDHAMDVYPVSGWACWLLLPDTAHQPLLLPALCMGGCLPLCSNCSCRAYWPLSQETVPAATSFCDTSLAAELKVTADGACVCWLSADTALLCLRSGQLLQLALLVQAAGGGARRVAVARAGAAPPPSCCVALDSSASTGQQQARPALFFVGSAAGDSLLVRASPVLPPSAATATAGTKRSAEAAASAADAAAAAGEGEAEGPSSKRMRLESFEAAVGSSAAAAADAAQAAADDAEQAAAAAAQQQEQEQAAAGAGSDSEDEEALIYGTALTVAASAPATAAAAAAQAAAAQRLQRYQLRVLDSLANIGPLRDFAIAEASGVCVCVCGRVGRCHEWQADHRPNSPTLLHTTNAAGGGTGGEGPPCLVACSGEGKGGALTVLRRSLVPDVLTEVPLPGLLGAWAVRYRRQEADPEPAGEEGAAAGEEGAAEGEGGRPYHAYLLLSFPGGTKVLAAGEELREVTER